MTTPIREMNCDQFADTLADFLEREVPEGTRAAMESHALGCAECGPLLADLRKWRVDAANLGELVPERDLWSGIAERIETPVVAIGGQDVRTSGRRATPLWIGLAAAGLVAITATITHQITKQTLVAPPQSVAVAPPDVGPVATLSSPKTDTAKSPTARQPNGPTAQRAQLASNKPTAEQTYSSEISRLRKIVDTRRADLDSSTVAVLEKNLTIIDNAIAQCRLALKKDPASSYLNESLNDALDNKVQLLRAAAGLPTRM